MFVGWWRKEEDVCGTTATRKCLRWLLLVVKKGRKMSAERLLMSWDKRSFSQPCKIEKNYNTRQFSFLWIQELFLFSSLAADKHLLTLLLELPASFCICLGRNFQKPSLLETRLFYKNEYMDIKNKNKPKKKKKLCVHACMCASPLVKRDEKKTKWTLQRSKRQKWWHCYMCVVCGVSECSQCWSLLLTWLLTAYILHSLFPFLFS